MNNLLRTLSLFITVFILAQQTSCGSEDTQVLTSEPKVTTTVQSLEQDHCIGDIAEACTAYGQTESICNEMQPFECQWVNDACIPERNCETLDISECETVASGTAPIESCSWVVVPACIGSIAPACLLFGKTQETCEGLMEYAIDCQWVNDACIPESDCETLNIDDCRLAATVTSCSWNKDEPLDSTLECSGSVAYGCAEYTTQSACENTVAMQCQWFLGYCTTRVDCGAYDKTSCLATIKETAPMTTCHWGTYVPKFLEAFVCSGDIGNACTTLGETQEACEGLTGIDCQWVNGACIPETNCSTLNESQCVAAGLATDPIPSCSWISQPGSCQGSSYAPGEAQCNQWSDQQICETLGLFDGNNNPVLSVPPCYWDTETGCHLKESVCTDQDNQLKCFSVAPPGFNFGLCTWVAD